ncbi:MAG: hypothetical protein ACTTJH_08445 [Bacteroidales bacterium]
MDLTSYNTGSFFVALSFVEFGMSAYSFVLLIDVTEIKWRFSLLKREKNLLMWDFNSLEWHLIFVRGF